MTTIGRGASVLFGVPRCNALTSRIITSPSSIGMACNEICPVRYASIASSEFIL
jgi:hypothetical protein